jgi:hypothetical protein
MLFMTNHGVQTKFWLHNPAALQLHAQKWCSGEHQGYIVKILSGPHISPKIAHSDGHSEAVKKGTIQSIHGSHA